MADRVQKQLLGYLIGALEDSERRRVERRLQRDPRWQAELAAVREALEPLGRAQQTREPPPGLAARTCQYVASFAAPAAAAAVQTSAVGPAAPRRARRMSAAVVPPSSMANWSWVDLSVGAAILVALSMLIFPAVQRNRAHARMMACQDNLRQFGSDLAQAGQSHPESPLGLFDFETPVNLEPNATRVLVALAPAGGPPTHDPRSPRFLSETPWSRPAAARPGHQGLGSPVWGQNVLFWDGRVTFVGNDLERPVGGTWLPESLSPVLDSTLTGLAP